MTYINPFLAMMDEKKATNPDLKDLFTQAKDISCLVRKLEGDIVIDTSATPEFKFGIVDLSTTRCKDWYKKVIQDNMIRVSRDSDGNIIKTQWSQLKSKFPASGWMADFGEYIPLVDSKLASGQDPISAHNSFPVWWAATNREAIDATGMGDEIVFFTRSGAARTPAYSTLHWLGDQLPSWDEYDGLASALRATLSVGLSGYSLTHSDIGGYTSVNQLPVIINFLRDEELLFRWSEMSSLSDAVYRTHEGLRPRKMVQVYDNLKVAEFFGKFAKVHAAFGVYRKELMVGEMQTHGTPLTRLMFFHYWHDANCLNLHDQFMIGSEFIAAPVLHPGVTKVSVYFPLESDANATVTWIHIFTGAKFTSGSSVTVDAPIGTPAVFYKAGSLVAKKVVNALVEKGIEAHWE
jgi:alpha-glucosidase